MTKPDLYAARAWANPAAGNGMRGKEARREEQHSGKNQPQEEKSVISSPNSITAVDTSITGPRPKRAVMAPAFGELHVPVRYATESKPTNAG